MNWKPHTERPELAPMSCLLAALDDDGGYFLLVDLYNWDGACFRREDNDQKPGVDVFWWLPESEALQGLPAFGYAQETVP